MFLLSVYIQGPNTGVFYLNLEAKRILNTLWYYTRVTTVLLIHKNYNLSLYSLGSF
jgi:hypothetical protein